jgi:hypothetical protein
MSSANLGTLSALAIVALLLNLKLVDFRCQLGQDVKGLFVVLELRGDQVRQIAEWLRSIQHLHLVNFTTVGKSGHPLTFFMTPCASST